jgi:hypothetical protein
MACAAKTNSVFAHFARNIALEVMVAGQTDLSGQLAKHRRAVI